MRVLFADDHPIFLEAVAERLKRAYPEMEIDAIASLSDVRARLKEGPPVDFLLLDFSLPGARGVEDIVTLIGENIGLPIAVTSGVAAPSDVAALLDAGVRGYLPKTLTGPAYAAAIGVMLEGGSYVPVETMQAVAEAAQRRDFLADRLTPRELDVLKGVSAGKANKEIGRDLDIHEVTVKLHVRSIFKKIGVRNRSQAALLAREHGMIGATGTEDSA